MGELSFALRGQLPQIILTSFLSRSHMKFGFSHKIFDVFGAGVSHSKVLYPNALTHFTARVVINGAYGLSWKVSAPIFNVHEYPVGRSVLNRHGVGRGRCDGWRQGRRVLAEFEVRLYDEAFEIFTPPFSSNVALVQ